MNTWPPTTKSYCRGARLRDGVHAGGEKEVALLASTLRMARGKQGKPIEILEATPARQCEPEFAQELADAVAQAEAVLSVSCGVGVQTLVRFFPVKPIFPGVNTTFMGETMAHGLWEERCQACGNCILEKTAGICPVARCAKQLLNGPCGGSAKGKWRGQAGDRLRLAVDLSIGPSPVGRLAALRQLMRRPKTWGTESRAGGSAEDS